MYTISLDSKPCIGVSQVTTPHNGVNIVYYLKPEYQRAYTYVIAKCSATYLPHPVLEGGKHLSTEVVELKLPTVLWILIIGCWDEWAELTGIWKLPQVMMSRHQGLWEDTNMSDIFTLCGWYLGLWCQYFYMGERRQ
jgi:hypothetical protein